MGLALDHVALERETVPKRKSVTCGSRSSFSALQAQNTNKRPITLKDAASAARDIVANLMTKWCDSGLPPLVLAETLIDAGLVQVIRERGPQAAAALLEEFRAT